MHRLMERMPPMLIGSELEEQLTCLPEYNPDVCNADAGTRLMQLNKLSEIYIPSQMSHEIYSKIYLAMLHSLVKKQTVDSVRQGNENHKGIQKFCQTVFSYQYVAKPSPITPEIIETLYQCSNGVIGLVVSLVMESQQMAFLIWTYAQSIDAS